jgi:large subunit ribosomal protein L18
MTKASTLRQRRKWRVRKGVRGAARVSGRPRLSVFRSNQHIYAQVIDDAQGRTVATASTIDKDLKGKLKSSCDKTAATERGAYLFHGRVKALADGARENGLSF